MLLSQPETLSHTPRPSELPGKPYCNQYFKENVCCSKEEAMINH